MCKRCPFATQKGIFYTSKGHVCNAKGHLYNAKEHRLKAGCDIILHKPRSISSCLSTFGLKSTDLYLVRVLFFLACYGYFHLFLIIIFCLSGCRRCLNLIQFVLFSDVTLPVSMMSVVRGRAMISPIKPNRAPQTERERMQN